MGDQQQPAASGHPPQVRPSLHRALQRCARPFFSAVGVVLEDSIIQEFRAIRRALLPDRDAVGDARLRTY